MIEITGLGWSTHMLQMARGPQPPMVQVLTHFLGTEPAYSYQDAVYERNSPYRENYDPWERFNLILISKKIQANNAPQAEYFIFLGGFYASSCLSTAASCLYIYCMDYISCSGLQLALHG